MNQGHLGVINHSYEWIINDFSKYTKIGECVRSPIFSFIINNVVFEWELILCPRSKSKFWKDYLSLYLRSHNRQEIKLKIKISLFNSDNEDVNEQSQLLIFTKEKCSPVCCYVIKRTEVTNVKNCLLKDDKLKIKWELISDHASKPAGTENGVLERHKQLDYFEKLLDDTEFSYRISDVQIFVDRGILQAHKCLLASKSSAFKEIFIAEENEGCCKITITDMSYESCKEMLRFIYVGKVKRLDEHVHELALAANRYHIVGLKKLCEDFLCRNITVDSALMLLQRADEFNMNILKEKVLEFIIQHKKAIIGDPNFKLVERMLHPDLITELFRAIIDMDE